jgi:hypothetical protein
MVGKNQTHKDFTLMHKNFAISITKKKLEGATQSSLQTTIKYINVPSILLVTKQETRKTFTIAIAIFFCRKN